MIDPRLLGWIRNELSKGVPEDQLRRSLISKGWSPENVDEAFKSISSSPAKNLPNGNFPNVVAKVSSKKSHTAIFIILGVAAIILTICFFLFRGALNVSNNKSSPVNENPSSSQNIQRSVSNSIVCGNIDCMINASKTCSPANFTFTGSEILLGVNNTGTSYFDISQNGSRCELYQKVLNQSLAYTNSTMESLLNSGMTFSQISQQEQKINQQVSVIIGKTGTCYFSSLGNMTTYLTKVKTGNFSGDLSCSFSLNGAAECNSTGDWALADSCTGELFNSSEYKYTP